MKLALAHADRLVKEALRRSLGGTRFELAWHCPRCSELDSRLQCDPPEVLLIDPNWYATDSHLPERLDGAAVTTILVTANGCMADAYDLLQRFPLSVIEAPALDLDGALLGGPEFLQRLERCVPHADSRLNAAQHGPISVPPLLALGASTGGPRALAKVLAVLPRDLDAAVVLVQHIESDLAAGLADWLGSQCRLPVTVAQRGEYPRPGHVYVAGPDSHLLVSPAGRFTLLAGAADELHVPSVDRLFSSLVGYAQPGAAALLTGMGVDGARGLAELRRAGWYTVAQDEASSVVYGMPRAAVSSGAAMRVLPLEQIGPWMLRQLQSRVHS